MLFLTLCTYGQRSCDYEFHNRSAITVDEHRDIIHLATPEIDIVGNYEHGLRNTLSIRSSYVKGFDSYFFYFKLYLSTKLKTSKILVRFRNKDLSVLDWELNQKTNDEYYLSFSTKGKELNKINFLKNNYIAYIQVIDLENDMFVFNKNLTGDDSKNIKTLVDCVYDAANFPN
jgi:hypothetical protein